MAELSRRGLDLWTAELAGINGVEIRVTNDRSLYSNAVFRFDDRMISYPYIKAGRTIDQPAALIAPADVGGIFDSLAGHIDRMWETGAPDQAVISAHGTRAGMSRLRATRPSIG